jgi:hypothetical protein
VRILQSCGLATAVTLVAGLLNYEVTARSDLLLGIALPGWWEAQRADHAIAYRALTGLRPLDRLLHEGAEAIVFYDDLLR